MSKSEELRALEERCTEAATGLVGGLSYAALNSDAVKVALRVLADAKVSFRECADREARRAAPEAVREAVEPVTNSYTFDEREKVANKLCWEFPGQSFATCSRVADAILSLLPDAAEARAGGDPTVSFTTMLREQAAAAEADEREACAKIADAVAFVEYPSKDIYGAGFKAAGKCIAATIRARAATPAPASPVEKEPVTETPEQVAEHFIQAAIDASPEPLRRLGRWLSEKLDDDDWKTADRMITGAAVSLARAHPPAGTAAEGWRTSYDDDSDVLYVSKGDPKEAVSDEIAPGVLLRRSMEDGSVVGLTVLDMVHRAAPPSPRTEE